MDIANLKVGDIFTRLYTSDNRPKKYLGVIDGDDRHLSYQYIDTGVVEYTVIRRVAVEIKKETEGE